MKTVIIGGVAGGASAAARLRRLDEKAEIVMLERGGFISFANCGLPYHIGGDIKDRDELLLQTPESFTARFGVDTRIFSEAVSIDRAGKTVTVKNTSTGEVYKESYDKLILSPGAVPFVPKIDGIDNEKVFTLRSIPDTLRIKNFIENESPESAVVVGGGYIGIEMAENLAKAGLSVTIVEMTDHVIASLDYDMACQVHRYLKRKGISLALSSRLASIGEEGGKLALTLEKEEQSMALSTDMVILSVGVKPDSELAGAAGLALGKTGAISVNEAMLTSDENIYAVGDAVEVKEFVTGQMSHIPLAGPANKQGRIAADNIRGLDSRYKGTQGSAIIKIFDMTVAVTGITETAAARQGIDHDKVFTLAPSNALYYPGSRDMSVKTVFEKTTGRILGAQIVGYKGVDKRCDVLATAIRAGMTAEDLAELELCYAPPFSSAKDPVNFAGYVIMNTVGGFVKNFHWHDVAALPRDGSVTLIDVRLPEEYEEGNIDGFVNIELDTLRENLGRLDREKPVYVHCRSGLRSYIACRLLTQNGFDCRNLSGGYWLYRIVTGG
ncbi:MAG: FAD-dependent oxidoreductase [Clostridiales bacterium]|nr:FAD-dependent oxidoreductase [Clostridiales bacterium]